MSRLLRLPHRYCSRQRKQQTRHNKDNAPCVLISWTSIKPCEWARPLEVLLLRRQYECMTCCCIWQRYAMSLSLACATPDAATNGACHHRGNSRLLATACCCPGSPAPLAAAVYGSCILCCVAFMPCASHTSASAENSAAAIASICSMLSCLLPVIRRRGICPANSIGRRMTAAGQAAAAALLNQLATPGPALLPVNAASQAIGVVCYCAEDRAMPIYDPWVSNPRLLVDKQHRPCHSVQLNICDGAQWCMRLNILIVLTGNGEPKSRLRVGVPLAGRAAGNAANSLQQ